MAIEGSGTAGQVLDNNLDTDHLDRGNNPLVKQEENRSDFVADTATTGTYADDDDDIVANINAIRDCLVTQGLMKSS